MDGLFTIPDIKTYALMAYWTNNRFVMQRWNNQEGDIIPVVPMKEDEFSTCGMCTVTLPPANNCCQLRHVIKCERMYFNNWNVTCIIVGLKICAKCASNDSTRVSERLLDRLFIAADICLHGVSDVGHSIPIK